MQINFTSMLSQAATRARSMPGKDPEKPAPTVSPGRTPASYSRRTQRAPISGQAVVRLASTAPKVVVIPV